MRESISQAPQILRIGCQGGTRHGARNGSKPQHDYQPTFHWHAGEPKPTHARPNRSSTDLIIIPRLEITLHHNTQHSRHDRSRDHSHELRFHRQSQHDGRRAVLGSNDRPRIPAAGGTRGEALPPPALRSAPSFPLRLGRPSTRFTEPARVHLRKPTSCKLA